ncbi:MAG: sel1 repeat family protein [Desulfuromonas sp.]|nr:MAG: sel1 repeat family protein [Desulfuromonas sp.]
MSGLCCLRLLSFNKSMSVGCPAWHPGKGAGVMRRWLIILMTIMLFATSIAGAFKGIEIDGLQKQANQGDAGAQAQLGVLYATGIQVPRDMEQAFSWYQKAADQGHPLGLYNLAFLYIRGEGVAEDMVKGRNLLNKAAQQGMEKAKFDLGYMYLQGIGGEQEVDRGMELIREAAYAGNKDARVYLQKLGTPIE